MDKITEALRKRYESIVRKRYMSEIRGDILKEFLLAIHLNNIWGEGEILANDGSVKKLLFPTTDVNLRELLLEIEDNKTYLLIWDPIAPENGEIVYTTPRPKPETFKGTIDYSSPLNVSSTKPEIVLNLPKVQQIIDNHVKEFGIWGIVLTDNKGNAIAWSLQKDKLMMDEDTVLDLVRLFVNSKIKFIEEVKRKTSQLPNWPSEIKHNFGVIMLFETYGVRAEDLLPDYVLVLIVEKSQLGISTIVGNRLRKELVELIGTEDVGAGG